MAGRGESRAGPGAGRSVKIFMGFRGFFHLPDWIFGAKVGVSEWHSYEISQERVKGSLQASCALFLKIYGDGSEPFKTDYIDNIIFGG